APRAGCGCAGRAAVGRPAGGVVGGRPVLAPVPALAVAGPRAPPGGEEGAVRVELLDAAETRIGDVDVPAPVGRHGEGVVELPVDRAAPLEQERAARRYGRGGRARGRGGGRRGAGR